MRTVSSRLGQYRPIHCYMVFAYMIIVLNVLLLVRGNVSVCLSQTMSETDIKGDFVADEGSQAQVDDQASGTKPIRQRTLTEKGQQYQIEQGEHKFRNLISTWRRRASEIECLLSEQGDISQVKGLRDIAMSVMVRLLPCPLYWISYC